MNIVGEIRYFLGGDYATLKYSESRTSLSIDIVLVPAPHRRQGLGTVLIARILLLADLTQRPVFVDARPIGVSGEEALRRLTTYYERLGFREYDRGLSVVHMRREPRDPEDTLALLQLPPSSETASQKTRTDPTA